MKTIKQLGLVLSTAVFISCAGDGAENEESHPIVDCYQETLEYKGFDYHEELKNTLQYFQEEGIPLKGAKTENLIEIFKMMKAGTLPHLCNINQDIVEKKLHLVSLRGCVKDVIYEDKEVYEHAQLMDNIYIYEFDSIPELNDQLDMIIEHLEALEGVPAWDEPFNIYLVAMAFKEYKRLKIEAALSEKATKQESLMPPPPPPVAPPPPPPPPQEIEILEDDYEEEYPVEVELPEPEEDTLN
jgi:hypothetical protein